ncbi:TPR repeat protein [Crocosphaera chwakensis CCY0110]|uniref:TPR repeat protein n=1 Tax=Crocosphaera chwakensis CCY0110 TaxID=391612 RepID=A3IN37_9CHRO|nr:TPR repeat protein [Crocosphaera chwakensis CCY0110]
MALCLILNIVLVTQVQGFNNTTSDRTVPLLNNLGKHHHEITTSSQVAQQYFDQGLMFIYGFNHKEAYLSFQEATKLDPNCAICYAGMALALGPNINAPMDEKAMPTAYETIEKAHQLSKNASAKEQAYIEALRQRYSPQPVDDRSSFDLAYANAMKEVVKQYPDDLDAATLYAEALMDLMPWNYWLEGGEPKPETKEIVATLESVLAKNPQHPGATHYYIHAVEASNQPEKAEAAADNLRDTVPGSGHLVHMPSHIYLRIGRYHDAALANEKAMKSDEIYLANTQEKGIYSALYYPHNIHFFWSAASMEGRSQDAIAAARKLVNKVSNSQIQGFPWSEIFLPSPYFSLVQFRQWDEMLTEPKPPEEFTYTNVMWHYGRGMAWVGKEQLDKAVIEEKAMSQLLSDKSLEKIEATGVPATQLINIADELLKGNVSTLKGEKEQAIAHYQTAVKLQDNLPYMEPPYWYYPTRYSLATALFQQGKFTEAEAVYRQDLQQHPHNGWSLFGLAETLKAQGKTDEIMTIEKEFKDAWKHAEFELSLSN